MGYIHTELKRIGAPLDLVQMLAAPVTKESSTELMQQADLVVVTGSRANVRAGYSSGKPALGVGAGNVAVIVDDSADVNDAAARDPRLEDIRQRDELLVGKQRDRPCRRLRCDAGGAGRSKAAYC